MSGVSIMKLILVMMLWAICFPLITAGFDYAPHISFAALRASIAGLTLTGLALILRRPLPSDWRKWITLAAIGLGATTLAFLGMFHAAEFVSPGIATVIANTQPLMAAVLAAFVLNEKLSAPAIIGLFLGFFGILFLTLPTLVADQQGGYFLGIAYIVLAAIGLTVSNVLLKRLAGTVDPLMAMGLQILIGSVPLIAIAWTFEDPTTVRWTLSFVGVLLTLSLLGTALVYWLWFSILETVSLSRANAFSFLVPIFGLSMGVLFYGEVLGATDLIGIALAILGVALVTRRSAPINNAIASGANQI